MRKKYVKKSSYNRDLPIDSRCIRSLKCLPTQPCLYSVDTIRGIRGGVVDGGCPWFINDEGAHYCFWEWAKTHSTYEADVGTIANKLMLTRADIYSSIRSGFAKIKEEFLK